MQVKKNKLHRSVITTATCSEVREVRLQGFFPPVNLNVAFWCWRYILAFFCSLSVRTEASSWTIIQLYFLKPHWLTQYQKSWWMFVNLDGWGPTEACDWMKLTQTLSCSNNGGPLNVSPLEPTSDFKFAFCFLLLLPFFSFRLTQATSR